MSSRNHLSNSFLSPALSLKRSNAEIEDNILLIFI